MRKLSLILCSLVTACATLTPEKLTSDKPLYEQASKLYAEKEYTEAITFFESLRNRFPQSPYLLDSEMKIADAKYAKGEYAEAEVEFQNFRTLHPTNAQIPYVIYMLGMTHYKRIPHGIDRDQTQTERALDVFEELTSRWPASPEAAKVPPLVTRCKRDLLERELYIANFYLHRDKYEAALPRLQNVRADPEFKDLSAEASYKLGYAQFKLKNFVQAKEILSAVIGNPDALKYHGEAKALLKKIGPL
jgi:outer membrane protein assembly factor BamD